LEELVRAVNGDDQYLSQEYQQLSRRNAVTMEEFAQFLSGLFPGQSGPNQYSANQPNQPTRWELEAMLK